MKHSVTITFPNEEMRNVFVAWMSDGGGECGAIESLEFFCNICNISEGQFVVFDYPLDHMINCIVEDE